MEASRLKITVHASVCGCAQMRIVALRDRLSVHLNVGRETDRRRSIRAGRPHPSPRHDVAKRLAAMRDADGCSRRSPGPANLLLHDAVLAGGGS